MEMVLLSRYNDGAILPKQRTCIVLCTTIAISHSHDNLIQTFHERQVGSSCSNDCYLSCNQLMVVYISTDFPFRLNKTCHGQGELVMDKPQCKALVLLLEIFH